MTLRVSERQLLFVVVLSGTASFMLYPLIALESIRRGLSALDIGIILGLLGGVGQILSPAIGRANARLGSRQLAIAGLLLRAAGLSLFVYRLPAIGYMAGAVVAGVGSSCTSLAMKTELMRLSATRTTVTFRSLMINIGAFIGPPIGGILYSQASFLPVAWTALSLYIGVAYYVSRLQFNAPEGVNGRAWATLLSMLSDYHFKRTSIAILIYWSIYSMWALIVSTLVISVYHSASSIAPIYTGNAIAIVLLQYFVVAKTLAHWRPGTVLFTGFLSFALAFGTLTLPPSSGMIVSFVSLFTIGEMLVSPILDELTSLARQHVGGLTQAYGAAASIAGVGLLIGSPAGGAILAHTGRVDGFAWIGAPLALFGCLTAISILRQERSI